MSSVVVLCPRLLSSVALSWPPTVGPRNPASASVASPIGPASGTIASADVGKTRIGLAPIRSSTIATGMKTSSQLSLMESLRHRHVSPGARRTLSGGREVGSRTDVTALIPPVRSLGRRGPPPSRGLTTLDIEDGRADWSGMVPGGLMGPEGPVGAKRREAWTGGRHPSPSRREAGPGVLPGPRPRSVSSTARRDSCWSSCGSRWRRTSSARSHRRRRSACWRCGRVVVDGGSPDELVRPVQAAAGLDVR